MLTDTDIANFHSRIYEIANKLDKIIELLELRNSIAGARNEMLTGKVEIQIPGTSDTNLCNCGNHKTGESTGGWYCPVHGHCS